MKASGPDHYAVLGLHRRCSDADIRNAYRLLAKRHHPDVNGGTSASLEHIQAINAAYETLSDPQLRQAYEAELNAPKNASEPGRTAKPRRNLSQDVLLRLSDFFRGVTLTVRIHDPGNPSGGEEYELIVPPNTAPGARFRLSRTGGGFAVVRVKAQPDFRFKVRGSDLRCDLKISSQRAAQGGIEMVTAVNGAKLRLNIPRNVAGDEILRLDGEGLPKARGGRGDLLVRIQYRPEMKVFRKPVR
ncbi:MAG: DnaJ domain-containing protein [Verrucomicrobiota bacterium]